MVKLGEQEKKILRKEAVSLVVRKHAKYEEHAKYARYKAQGLRRAMIRDKAGERWLCRAFGAAWWEIFSLFQEQRKLYIRF